MFFFSTCNYGTGHSENAVKNNAAVVVFPLTTFVKFNGHIPLDGKQL